MAKSTITFTTGVPGAGKTYSRVRDLCDDFLPRSKRIFVHNLPLDEEAIAEFVARRHKGTLAVDYLGRMRRIPEEVVASWRAGVSGPWEYFQDGELANCHIVLDEVHEMIATGSERDLVKRWENWLGTLRHAHCTLEAITQDPSRVHRCMQGRAGRRLELTDVMEERDPFMRVQLEEWFRLWSAITGRLLSRPFVEVEYLKRMGKWKRGRSKWYWREPEYFGLYKSFSREGDSPVADEDHGVPSRKEVLHFLWRHGFGLFGRLLLVVLVAWICFGGGFAVGLRWCLAWMQRRATQGLRERVEQVEPGRAGQAGTKSESKTGKTGVSGNADSAVSEVEGQGSGEGQLPPGLAEWQERLGVLQGQVQDALVLLDRNLAYIRIVGRCEGGVLLVGGRVLREGSRWGRETVVRLSWDGCELDDGRWLRFVSPDYEPASGSGMDSRSTARPAGERPAGPGGGEAGSAGGGVGQRPAEFGRPVAPRSDGHGPGLAGQPGWDSGKRRDQRQ